MAPPHPPPELIDDATAEILLRVLPDEPEQLVRAAVVCKPWRRLLTDPAFLRRYCVFHRTPPLLGFICDNREINHFIPTAAANSPCISPAFDWRVLDCRHGRVLVSTFDPEEIEGLIVWDPITGHQQQLCFSSHKYTKYTAAVLCAMDGCDHLDCHSGPFCVAIVGTRFGEGMSAHVYSSKTDAWSYGAFMEHSPLVLTYRVVFDAKPGVLVENSLNFIWYEYCQGEWIAEYDLGRQDLLISRPPLARYENGIVLMEAEGGGLGLAGMHGSEVHLWRVGDSEGTPAWVQYRVIELNTLFPALALSHAADLVGFAEGISVLFVRTDIGVFTMELKSGRVRKVSDNLVCHNAFPFMRFYTPELCYREVAITSGDKLITAEPVIGNMLVHGQFRNPSS
ncbi:hypothetical protein ACP70R_015212 [Stipagrostis hirtigluma subsp. patula]